MNAIQSTVVATQVAVVSSQASVPAKVKPVIVKAQVHRVNLHALLERQAGRFVGVDFIKVDGSERALNGRLGVLKHLQGGSNTVAGTDRPYLVVYDVKTKGYRAVNLATVSEVRAKHTIYTVIG